MLTIGDKIRDLRKSQSHSQEDLSKLLQVTRQAISKWENNASLPDIHTLKNLSNIYNVPLDFFNTAEPFEYDTNKPNQKNFGNIKSNIYIRIGLLIANIMSGIFFGPFSLIVSIPSLIFSFKNKRVIEVIICFLIFILGTNQLMTIMFGRDAVPHTIDISVSSDLE